MAAPRVPGTADRPAQILELVAKFPGISASTLARRLHTNIENVGYAVRVLIKQGRIYRQIITDPTNEHCGEKGLFLQE